MNSSRSSALDASVGILCLALAVLGAGCGPKDGKDEYAEAQQAYSLRNLEKASELFAKSAELDPGNADALVMLARSRLDLGDLAGATDAIAKAQAIVPDDIDVRELSAQLAWHTKNYDLAREKFLAIAKDGSLEPAVRAQAYAGLGVVDMTLGGISSSGSQLWVRDRARTEFLQAIALDPRCASARYHLALVYRDEPFGYADAALEQFQFFVRLSTTADPRMQNVQRVVIPALKEEIGARLASRPGASNRDSTASAALLKKAEEAWKKSTFKTARLRYEEAYKADPLSYPAALGLAKAWEKTDTTANGMKRAYEYYRAACQLRAGSVKTLIAAADLAVKLGQHASAADLYSRAVASSARDITAIDGLIRSLRKCGNGQSAAVYQKYRDTIPVKRR